MGLLNNLHGLIRRGSSPRTTRMLETSMGMAGFRVVTNGQTVNGLFVAIQCIAESQVSGTVSAGDNLPSLTLANGTIIVGPFTEVVVTSGTVLVYIGD